MIFMIEILKPLQFFNDITGRIGRSISAIALALMVFVILLQVFCRYILNNALPWPDEAARFLMLWLTGLMAPIALRQSGFVAIDTLHRFLPRRGVSLLALILALTSLIVLSVAVQLGWKHVNWLAVFQCIAKNSIAVNWFQNDQVETCLDVSLDVCGSSAHDCCKH